MTLLLIEWILDYIVLLLMLKQHLMPGEICQMHLIQWIKRLVKIKEIRVKERLNA